MKVAIFIVEGDTQLVLSPENEFEKFALKRLSEGNHIEVSKGRFARSDSSYYTYYPYYERYSHGYNDDSYIVSIEQRDCSADQGEGPSEGGDVDRDGAGIL